MNSLDDLLSKVQEIDKIPEHEWLHDLDERKKRELDFPDRDRDRARRKALDSNTRKQIYGNKKSYDRGCIKMEPTRGFFLVHFHSDETTV